MSVPDRVECPYCGQHQPRTANAPPLPKALIGTGIELTPEPTDLATMPYVRDVTFDPSITDDPAAPDRGSWIGSDFMRALDFDRRFGILTPKDGRWPRVAYRVELCPHCLHYFDAYYSFHPTLSLADQFPHLFALEGTLLPIPDHQPLPGVFVARMAPRSSGGARGIVAAVLAWWLLGTASMALARLVVGRFEQPEYAVAAGSLLLGLAAGGVLVHVLRQLLELLAGPRPMGQVIACDGASDNAVRRENRVRHWVSFTRCRFAGRPVAKEQTLRTATELLGGMTAVISLVAVILLTGDLTPAVFVPRLVDAFWWFPVAYMIGSSLQLAATTVHYVLAGLTRVPIRLDDHHPVGDVPALRAIQRYVKVTGTTVAVLLVTLLAANTALRQVLGGSSPMAWVDVWFLVIVLLGLVSLGLTHRPSYLVLGLVAAAVTMVLQTSPDLMVPLPVPWSFDLVTLWLGLVFTVLLVTETRSTNAFVDRAMRNTLEARAARLLRHGHDLDAQALAHRRATLEAARVVIDTRSGVTVTAAWIPLVMGAVLPSLLESLISSALPL